MQQPSPSSGSCCAAGDEDSFDVVLPPDFLFLGDAADGHTDEPVMEQQQQQQFGEAQKQGEEERLLMSYHGQMFVFDSVQPQKVETILSLLNGQDMAPPSVKTQLTHLVQPIAVPQSFDRPAALTRYREKRRSLKPVVRADHGGRREVASRHASDAPSR